MGNQIAYRSTLYDVESIKKALKYDDPFVTVDDSNVRYNEVQFKAAHNSYQRNENIFQQLDLKDGACGAIELDFVVDPNSINRKINIADQMELSWTFGVQHDDEYSPLSPSLSHVLHSLREWSNKNVTHEVVTIHLDMKRGGAIYGSHDEFVMELDSVVLNYLGRDKIFAPTDLQRDTTSLIEGVKKYGWPTLTELRGKFILVITGDDTDAIVRNRRETYCRTKPTHRLCFVDLDQRACKPFLANPFTASDLCSLENIADGSRIFVNIQLGKGDWSSVARSCFDSGLFVSRVWKANKELDFLRARAAGINLIATDKIRNHNWAFVSNTKLYARIQKFAI